MRSKRPTEKTVRVSVDVPEDVHKRLFSIATAQRRSLAQQVIVELERAALSASSSENSGGAVAA
jgi:predicted HicB family RNase H-like nuclease